MAVKQVKLENFAQELSEFTDRTLEEQRNAVISAIIKSIPRMVAVSPVDTGLYAQSWNYQLTPNSIILGNYAPHAPIIEIGARPFFPPIGPLLAWAKRVLGDASQPPKYSDNVWGLAKGTQLKISREGMQPHNIMENEIPNIIEDIKLELKK